MTCVCGCPQDEHGESGTDPCELSEDNKKHLCGGFEADEDATDLPLPFCQTHTKQRINECCCEVEGDLRVLARVIEEGDLRAFKRAAAAIRRAADYIRAIEGDRDNLHSALEAARNLLALDLRRERDL